MCNFGSGYHGVQFCEIVLNLDQWFRRCCLKDSLSRALTISCLVQWNHLCNFCRGHYGEHLCEIILNLDQWLRRCHFIKKLTDDRQRPITIVIKSYNSHNSHKKSAKNIQNYPECRVKYMIQQETGQHYDSVFVDFHLASCFCFIIIFQL